MPEERLNGQEDLERLFNVTRSGQRREALPRRDGRRRTRPITPLPVGDRDLGDGFSEVDFGERRLRVR